MTNTAMGFLLVTSCLFGSLTALLFLLAALDPSTDGAELRRPKASSGVSRPTQTILTRIR